MFQWGFGALGSQDFAFDFTKKMVPFSWAMGFGVAAQLVNPHCR
jgi:hypothetical protein